MSVSFMTQLRIWYKNHPKHFGNWEGFFPIPINMRIHNPFNLLQLVNRLQCCLCKMWLLRCGSDEWCFEVKEMSKTERGGGVILLTDALDDASLWSCLQLCDWLPYRVRSCSLKYTIYGFTTAAAGRAWLTCIGHNNRMHDKRHSGASA